MPFPVDESRILTAEKALGTRLPAELRSRLKTENGGEVEADNESWRLFPVWDDRNRRTIARTANHIVRENQSAHADGYVPDGLIPIAEDGGGNYLVFRIGEEGIFDWLHETGELTPVNVKWRPETP